MGQANVAWAGGDDGRTCAPPSTRSPALTYFIGLCIQIGEEGRNMAMTRNMTMTQPSAGSKRPLSRRIQARVMRVVNVPMRMLLRLPFRTPLSGRLMLLCYTGRKSGKAYQQP